MRNFQSPRVRQWRRWFFEQKPFVQCPFVHEPPQCYARLAANDVDEHCLLLLLSKAEDGAATGNNWDGRNFLDTSEASRR